MKSFGAASSTVPTRRPSVAGRGRGGATAARTTGRAAKRPTAVNYHTTQRTYISMPLHDLQFLVKTLCPHLPDEVIKAMPSPACCDVLKVGTKVLRHQKVLSCAREEHVATLLANIVVTLLI